MNATLQKNSGLARNLEFDVPVSEVQTVFEEVLRHYQRTMKIDGHRPGKAPFAVLRAKLGQQIHQEVLSRLLQYNYLRALESYKLEPAAAPHFKIKKFAEGASLQFSALVEVLPKFEVRLPTPKDLELPTESIDKAQVQVAIDQMLAQKATFSDYPKSHRARLGDYVALNFVGYVKDAEIPNSRIQGHVALLGKSNLLLELESAVEGMASGEKKSVNLSFPKDYHLAHLAGQVARFEVEVVAIKERTVPTLNDETAKKFWNAGSADELRKRVAANLDLQLQAQRERKRRDVLFQKLRGLNPIEVPSGLVSQKKIQLINEVGRSFIQQGLTSDRLQIELKKLDLQLATTARDLAHNEILLNALATQLGLNATPQDVEAKMDEIAKTTGVDRAQIANSYATEDSRKALLNSIHAERVIGHFLNM